MLIGRVMSVNTSNELSYINDYSCNVNFEAHSIGMPRKLKLCDDTEIFIDQTCKSWIKDPEEPCILLTKNELTTILKDHIESVEFDIE